MLDARLPLCMYISILTGGRVVAERSVRGISDELWQAAKEKAVREGSSLSDVVEALLARWTKEP